MKETTIVTNSEHHECVIFAQSTKIGTHENKAIHSIKHYNVRERIIFKDHYSQNVTGKSLLLSDE